MRGTPTIYSIHQSSSNLMVPVVTVLLGRGALRITSISGGILVGAIVGRERRLTADDDDDDEEQQHSNTVSGKEANADNILA